ncbi:hypothetical protein BV25DRAFT_1922183, partial [Artomyces pyxidatus]
SNAVWASKNRARYHGGSQLSKRVPLGPRSAAGDSDCHLSSNVVGSSNSSAQYAGAKGSETVSWAQSAADRSVDRDRHPSSRYNKASKNPTSYAEAKESGNVSSGPRSAAGYSLDCDRHPSPLVNGDSNDTASCAEVKESGKVPSGPRSAAGHSIDRDRPARHQELEDGELLDRAVNPDLQDSVVGADRPSQPHGQCIRSDKGGHAKPEEDRLNRQLHRLGQSRTEDIVALMKKLVEVSELCHKIIGR